MRTLFIVMLVLILLSRAVSGTLLFFRGGQPVLLWVPICCGWCLVRLARGAR